LNPVLAYAQYHAKIGSNHGDGAERERDCHVRGAEIEDRQQPRRQVGAW
jgi:hypothetical protein